MIVGLAIRAKACRLMTSACGGNGKQVQVIGA
jgi:hypothetical protein